MLRPEFTISFSPLLGGWLGKNVFFFVCLFVSTSQRAKKKMVQICKLTNGFAKFFFFFPLIHSVYFKGRRDKVLFLKENKETWHKESKSESK